MDQNIHVRGGRAVVGSRTYLFQWTKQQGEGRGAAISPLHERPGPGLRVQA